jgi:hypothetical protein
MALLRVKARRAISARQTQCFSREPKYVFSQRSLGYPLTGLPGERHMDVG